MVYAMLTIAFHNLMFFGHQPKGTFGKLFGLVPAIIVVALLVLKPVTSMMNGYYTQWAFISQVSSAGEGVGAAAACIGHCQVIGVCDVDDGRLLHTVAVHQSCK